MTERPALDPLEYVHSRLSDAERAFDWQPAAPPDWKVRLRTRLGTAIGLPAKPVAAPSFEVLDARDMGAYLREMITYQSRPGLLAFAYLLTPKGLTGPT